MPQSTTRTPYWQLLRDPRWQRKRLEVLERAEFTCTHCGATDATLHVHHSYYEKGLPPWDYPVQSLHVLCAKCHGSEQAKMAALHRQIGRLGLCQMSVLRGYAMGLEAMQCEHMTLHVDSYETAMGVADCWGVAVSEVLAQANGASLDSYKLMALLNAKRAAECA